MTNRHTTAAAPARSGPTPEADPPPCWCLALHPDTTAATDEPAPLNDEELATIEEFALLETERVHGNCGLHGARLVEVAAILVGPARDAYIEARVNGLCEEGATEICRDVLTTAVGSRSPQRA